MISKSFLSGIFSVVSFMLITTFAISSTIAQCPPDVSGMWTIKGVETKECSSDPSDNGTRKFKFEIPVVVTQIGNEISASWVDDNGNNELTGVVNGNSVYFKAEDSGSSSIPCGAVNHFVGIIKGNRIKGNGTGTEVGDGTCNDGNKWHFKFNIKIVK